jgi:DNA-binding response OmpR family regulator
MQRMLVIDDDREVIRELSLASVEHGIAMRFADTVCEGVRVLLDTPASVVLIDADAFRRSGGDQVRLFEKVAPGVPVVVLLPPQARVEDRVRYEAAGFTVAARPFQIAEILAKVEPLGRPDPTPPEAAGEVEAFCAGRVSAAS